MANTQNLVRMAMTQIGIKYVRLVHKRTELQVPALQSGLT